jgi:hypothetical protein
MHSVTTDTTFIASSTSPQIKLVAESKLIVMGSTYRAGDKTAKADLNSILDLSTEFASFEGRFDIQSPKIGYSGSSVELEYLKRVFRGGLHEGIYSDIGALPIEDGVPSVDAAWRHKIAYRFTPATPFEDDPTTPATAPLQPLPDLEWQFPTASAGGVYPQDAQSVAAYPTSRSHITVAPAMLATNTGSTDPFNPQAGIDTCDIANNRVYVQIDFGATVTIGSDDWSGTPGRFCGLIAARDVSIDLGSANREFYGQIIAKRITVTSSGKNTLKIYSPIDNIPSGLDQAQILIFMQNLAARQAHNFFVPILRDTTLSAAEQRIFQFRPHGAVAAYFKQVATVRWAAGAVTREVPKVGYVYGDMKDVATNTIWEGFRNFDTADALDRNEVLDALTWNANTLDGNLVLE